MPRVYERKFDWDEAKRLRKDGWSLTAIAKHFGVSATAIYRVTDPRAYARMQMRVDEYQRGGTCSVCGARCSRNYHTENPRCKNCASEAQVTTVREDALKCLTCGEWKWDTAFPWSRTKNCEKRRARHRTCRACHTILKRAYRERTKAPCSSCGTPVTTVDRRYKDKPLECHECAMRRIHAERAARRAA